MKLVLIKIKPHEKPWALEIMSSFDTQSEMMFSFFFQTDYDLYVNHMMASHDMVKHTAHNVLNIDVNKVKKTWDMDVTF